MTHSVVFDRFTIAQLQQAGLMPPIIAIMVGEQDDKEVLVVEVCAAMTDEQRERLVGVLGATPFVLREVSFDPDGRRPGVDYRS